GVGGRLLGGVTDVDAEPLGVGGQFASDEDVVAVRRPAVDPDRLRAAAGDGVVDRGRAGAGAVGGADGPVAAGRGAGLVLEAVAHGAGRAVGRVGGLIGGVLRGVLGRVLGGLLGLAAGDAVEAERLRDVCGAADDEAEELAGLPRSD